jgi:hypothetical protein
MRQSIAGVKSSEVGLLLVRMAGIDNLKRRKFDSLSGD